MRSEVSLADACSLIVDCPHKTAPESDEAYAYAVGTKAISEGRINFATARPVDALTYRTWVARATPTEGDVILCREAPVGPAARVPAGPRVCLGQRTVLIRANPEVADPAYLFYALSAPATQDALHTLSEGSTVPHLNVGDVRQLGLELPELGEQQQIASILNGLDEKIDSNRRLATLLEAMVATMFRRWFVHEKPRAGDEGREDDQRVGALADLADIAKESVQPSETPQAIFEHFSFSAFDAGGEPEVATGTSILSGKTRIPDRDVVLMSKLNPRVRRVWWPRPSGAGAPVCSPEFLVLVPREGIPTSYLYAVAAFDEHFYGELLSHVTGTTGSRQRVKPRDALGCAVVAPSADELRAWDAFARPLLDFAHGTLRENDALASSRDALLPRLVSGAIRVPVISDVEKTSGLAAEEAAA